MVEVQGACRLGLVLNEPALIRATTGNPVKKFLIKQFLPIGFVIAIIIALVWPAPGNYIYHMMIGDSSWKLFSTLHIFIIFFLFGITLETSELKVAFKSWQVLIMGFVMILVGTAITGFVPMHMNFKPAVSMHTVSWGECTKEILIPPFRTLSWFHVQAFGIGMAVFAACPTSLSQGVTVVIQVRRRLSLTCLPCPVSSFYCLHLHRRAMETQPWLCFWSCSRTWCVTFDLS